MADSYTANGKVRKIEQGAYPNAWAAPINNDAIELLDDMIAGLSAINLGVSTSYSLAALANGTDSESRAMILKFTGTPASAVTVTVPASVTSKLYLVANSCGQNLTIKYAATAGVMVATGERTFVWADGTTVNPSATVTQTAVGAVLYPRTTAEIAVGVTPTNYYIPNEDSGVIRVERYGALGNDSANDYTAINNAMLVAAQAGGGDVEILCGKIYRYGTALTIPEHVRLRSRGSRGIPSDATAIIKPTNAVSIGINDSGANRRGIGLENITIDMQLMPNGSTGILWSGVHQGEIRKCLVIGHPDATSIGMHFRGDSASAFGTLYIGVYDCYVATTSLDRGIGIKLESVGSERANAITFINTNVAHMTTGWIFDGTGSGILCLNCNSESNAGNGANVLDTLAGTAVRWIGGEVNANGGWGFTGSGGRILVDNTVMGSNASGDINTSSLTIGAQEYVTSTGPSIAFDGVHIRTDKSFVGGSANQTITAANTIAADGLKKRLTAASAITMTSNPQIADGSGNQLVTLIGTSNTNTVTLVNGNGLRLRSGITLRANDTIMLEYDSGGSNDWAELGRSVVPVVTTFTSADATPTVLNGELFQTAGTTTITDFDDGVVGQTIRIKANASITITDNASIILNGSANFAMTTEDTLTLTMFDDQVWHEVARAIS